ncbi:MAG: DnaB-like helicase N-terminal domain-containing protein, partial [Thermodesulfobacteriota bacterium]|nr:DnaB-like helicase N-terminal domain-containing protein [Thermodesulfobacteriota bacterium]
MAVAGEKKDQGRRGEAVKLPPQSLEAEQSLLGAVLHDNSALARILEIRIGPDDFYREMNGLIFRAMIDLFESVEPVDLVTLSESLKKTGALDKVGGPAYLA